MGKSVRLAILTLVLLWPGWVGASESAAAQRVARVIDGDTLDLAGGPRIRLIGINAPEYEPWKNIEQPCGRQAAEYARKNFLGKQVSLEYDVERQDKYGRTLAYVFLEDGRLINELLVREGYARARYYRPNGKYRARLETAQRLAQKNPASCLTRADSLG